MTRAMYTMYTLVYRTYIVTELHYTGPPIKRGVSGITTKDHQYTLTAHICHCRQPIVCNHVSLASRLPKMHAFDTARWGSMIIIGWSRPPRLFNMFVCVCMSSLIFPRRIVIYWPRDFNLWSVNCACSWHMAPSAATFPWNLLTVWHSDL